ncbi:hypothetical protein [Rhodoferax sp. OV413]|uniref:hypothetical protein n=1 Tax=Rhodoferax sp. OV413 TaxID=1855285 RepID=UPI0025FB390B|nr:hypothetical protein [Rhodoferax sp. OV413]
MSISFTQPFASPFASLVARSAAFSRALPSDRPASPSLYALAQGLWQYILPRRETVGAKPAPRQPIFAMPFVAAGAVSAGENCSKADIFKASSKVPSHAPSPVHPLRVVRVVERGQPRSQVGRMVISGRMADVCAELDRLAACEAA